LGLAERAAIIAVVALAVCLGLGVPAARAASTRYVAVAAAGGDDDGGANTCASPGSPCLTVGHAVSESASGDTIAIGPGRFSESVSATTKALTFVGAGSGTPTSFNPSTDTFIDAAGTADPALTTGDHDTTLRDLKIRGGVGSGTAIEPAVSSTGGASTPMLSVSGSVLLQSSPPSPGSDNYALLVDPGPSGGANLSVTDSTVVGFADGVRVYAHDGTLTITRSTITTPAPAQTGPVLPLSDALNADIPTAVTESRLLGITAIAVGSRPTTITGSVISASGRGVYLSDGGNGPTLMIRDSVIEPASGTLLLGVAINSSPPETLVPSLDLTFDSVLAMSAPPSYALDVIHAAAGTHVHARNTILRAIDTSGGSGADDIASGSQAVNWDLGYTDYTQTTGVAVPAPGSGTNLDVLPFFAAPDNLRLTSTSTLFDKGDPSVVVPGETDVTGTPRALAHACGGAALPDLGAYEAPAPSCPGPTVSIGSPANGATYTQGQTVTASYVCAAPAPVAVTACAGPVANGMPIDTETTGSHSFAVTATASDGAIATATVSYTVRTPVPSLGTIRASHKTWREGRKLASIASTKRKRRPPVGTTFTFTLNTAATLKLTFTHRVRGRRVKRKCVAPTRHNKHDRSCKRTTTAGTLTLTGHAGTDKISFQGRLSKKRKLAPGVYTLTITASNTAGRTRPRTTTFTIARA
jgi:hypothetical protein